MNRQAVFHKTATLRSILTTVECIEHRALPPRKLLARLYAGIFLVLTLLATPSEEGALRVAAALLVGMGSYVLLERIGPGHRNWWARLSDQLWTYEPVDARGLERLRKDLLDGAPKGPDAALKRVMRWTRTELDAIERAAL